MNNQKITGIVVGIFIALVAFGVLGFVYAQQSEDKISNNPMGFVDANNNGICDHMESGDCPMLNGGSCPMNCPMMNKFGFVDANNDGICDNMEFGNCPMMNNQATCPMMSK